MSTEDPFYTKKITCPVCNREFSTLAVRSSRIYVMKRESDYHTIYKGVSPLHYSIAVCPACQYAASARAFTHNLPPAQANQLKTALSKLTDNNPVNLCALRDLDAVLSSFQMAVRTAQLKRVAAGELAGLLLGTAWIAREAVNPEIEAYYLQEALTKYTEAYEFDFNTIGNLNEIQIIYLIGELNRRCKNYSQAISWFNQVITHKNIKMHPAEEKLAREQWALAREESTHNPAVNAATANQPVTEKAPVKKDKINEPTLTGSPSVKRSASMHMSINLYPEQIDWLTRVVNSGYNHSRKLTTKEDVLRALLDAVMEILGNSIPDQFSNEEELKNCIIAALKNEI